MCTTHSPRLTLLATCLALAATTATHSLAGDYKAFGYDTPAFIDFELSEIRVHESAAKVAINIIRTGEFRTITRLQYQTEEGDATEGQDYAGAGGTITFQPGEGYKTVYLSIVADDQTEPAESFRFTVSANDPNVVLYQSSVGISIEDGPAPISQPELRIAAGPNGTLLLSWEGSDRCALQRSVNPQSGVWEAVECTPVVKEGRCEVSQPAGAHGAFAIYRLRVP